MTAYYESDEITVHAGDCLEVMAELPDASVDAVVTDPPYGLDFMRKHWDDGAVAFDVETWRQCLRLLKPGGHLLAFGGTRTFHRMAVAIEDAGFEIRDSIAWLYGSGFPKGANTLKPAFEPVVVARKPPVGSVSANVLEYGTGGLNIDGCRVETTDILTGSGTPPLQYGGQNSRPFHESAEPRGVNQNPAGRWPTNVVIDEHTAEGIDGQSGISRDGTAVQRNGGGQRIFNHGDGLARPDAGYGGEGGASRFFPTFRYEAKAPTSERPSVNGIAHPTVKPIDLMRWLVKLVTPPGGLVLDPFAGSGTTAEACIHEHLRCITIEREPDYLPLIVARLSKPMEIGFNFGESA